MPVNKDKKVGWIEVICGCMFSGKTEELIKRINSASTNDKTIKVFKPKIDNRYHQDHVVSHNATSIAAVGVQNSVEILELSKEASIVGIDEVQFFDDHIVEVCNTLANKGVRVIVAGLDMNSKGKPFGPIPHLLATAEYITKLHAVCAISGEMASYSFRKTTDESDVLVGAQDIYEARSRQNFFQIVHE